MFDRVDLDTVIKELKIDNNTPSKRTRNLAFKWACHKARGEFKDLGKLIKNSTTEFKNSITPGNFFDIAILSVFGSIDATICATMHAIHGIASAIFSPALIIKKAQETQPLEEEKYPPISFENIDEVEGAAEAEASNINEDEGAAEAEASNIDEATEAGSAADFEVSSSEESEEEGNEVPLNAIADVYETTERKEEQVS